MLSINAAQKINFTGVDQQAFKKVSASKKDDSENDNYTVNSKEQVRKACRKSFWVGVISTAVLFLGNAVIDNYFDQKEAKGNKPSWPFRWLSRLFKK